MQLETTSLPTMGFCLKCQRHHYTTQSLRRGTRVGEKQAARMRSQAPLDNSVGRAFENLEPVTS